MHIVPPKKGIKALCHLYNSTGGRILQSSVQTETFLSGKVQKGPEHCSGSQTVKKGHCNSPSADCKSKIGDMCGDFRAISLEIASLREQTAGRMACHSTSARVQSFVKVAAATFTTR